MTLFSNKPSSQPFCLQCPVAGWDLFERTAVAAHSVSLPLLLGATSHLPCTQLLIRVRGSRVLHSVVRLPRKRCICRRVPLSPALPRLPGMLVKDLWFPILAVVRFAALFTWREERTGLASKPLD